LSIEVPMNKVERSVFLSKWIRPSSDSEQDRQNRAERMIREAIERHDVFSTTDVAIYAKGSYANNTNVRLDSDVDIVVECRDCFYFDYYPSSIQPSVPSSAYTGKWTPALWREEVLAALAKHFGPREVDSSGAIAIVIAEKYGSRPSADVVPSFRYRRFYSADRSSYEEGSKVFGTTGKDVINWPQQQLENGREKNSATGGRYKNYARALKNAENVLSDSKTISAKPSYLMECLAWNVPDDILTSGDLDDGFRATLGWLYTHLTSKYERENWVEPNRLKYLFGPYQKWSVDDGKELVHETWKFLYA